MTFCPESSLSTTPSMLSVSGESPRGKNGECLQLQTCLA
jgi:hypothetical protein